MAAINYKVYLTDPMAPSSEEAEVRRFAVDLGVGESLVYLEAKLVDLFPRLRHEQFHLTWTDADGDRVRVGSDEELRIALRELDAKREEGAPYKMQVIVKGKKEEQKEPHVHFGQEEADLERHENVVCDGCERGVVGFRYKCMTCPDYDLCAACEAKRIHPGHNMVRIASPENVWPGHFFRRMNKMHERMHKKAANMAAKEAERAAKKAHKEAQQDAAQDAHEHVKQHVHASMEAAKEAVRNNGPIHPPGPMPGFNRPGHRRGHAGHMHRGGSLGRGCVWDNMYKGWTGEHDATNAAYNEAAGKAAEAAAAAGAAANAAAAGAVAAAGAAAGAGAETINMHKDYLKTIAQNMFGLLDPLGVDISVEVEHDGERSKVLPKEVEEAQKKQQEEKEQSPEPKQQDEQQVEQPKKTEEDKQVEQPKKAEEEQQDKKESSATSSPEHVTLSTADIEAAAAAASASDEEESYVVIDQQQEVSREPTPTPSAPKVVNIPVHVEEKKPEQEPSAPPAGAVGGAAAVDNKRTVEVPIQVSDKPAKVLFASPDGTLYPELPKPQPEQPKTEKKPEQPKKKVEDEMPLASHPDPRIQVALQAMLNMGFTNEGGWLSQLLEAKDGDIGRTLDVLQPVRPVRQ